MRKKPPQQWNEYRATSELQTLLLKRWRAWEGRPEKFVAVLEGAIDIARGVGGAQERDRPGYSGIPGLGSNQTGEAGEIMTNEDLIGKAIAEEVDRVADDMALPIHSVALDAHGALVSTYWAARSELPETNAAVGDLQEPVHLAIVDSNGKSFFTKLAVKHA